MSQTVTVTCTLSAK